jgi:hypothetical protein
MRLNRLAMVPSSLAKALPSLLDEVSAFQTAREMTAKNAPLHTLQAASTAGTIAVVTFL